MTAPTSTAVVEVILPHRAPDVDIVRAEDGRQVLRVDAAFADELAERIKYTTPTQRGAPK